MNSDELLFLTPREIQSLLTLDECIGAVEHAFRAYGGGKAAPPAVLSLHTEGGGFHVKAGLMEFHRSYFAAKVNGNFPENSARFGLPTIQGVIVLCDAGNGSPLAVMDSRDITSFRTAAATAVAAKHLARQDSRTLTICGCGIQGRIQLRALSRVCRLETVFAYDRDAEQASRFSRDLTSELMIAVRAVSDLMPAVRQSDICVTCTTSMQPLLASDDVSPGTFIAAVGADNPQKQEIHPFPTWQVSVVRHPRTVRNGGPAPCVERGVVTRADVYAELGEVVAGKKPGRESEDEITIFDSTGMALQDRMLPPSFTKSAHVHSPATIKSRSVTKREKHDHV